MLKHYWKPEFFLSFYFSCTFRNHRVKKFAIVRNSGGCQANGLH